VPLANVAPVVMRWLWPGRIPIGRVTLLVSDPGLGKSLVTLDIAARVSSGTPWPDETRQGDKENRRQGEAPVDLVCSSSRCLPVSLSSPLPVSPSPPPRVSPASVLLLTAEDSLADTIRPRLEAMGADCSRILAITAVPGQGGDAVPRQFQLRRDLARLANLLDTVPDCRLLVVDPISAHLGSTSENVNADVHGLLVPLANLARQRNLAVLAVSHLRKQQGAAIHRTMGSLAFVAAARAVWVIVKDPDDQRRRLLLPLKNNLAPDVTGLAYTIESTDPDGSGPPVVCWSPEPVSATADLILARRPRGRPDDERQQAARWLRETLSAGPRLARDIKEEAEVNGFSQGTLRRAFRDVAGQAVREGFGPFGQWLWRLPGVNGQSPDGGPSPLAGLPDLASILNRPPSPLPSGEG
jgi:putative DNA primase/helicase